MEKSSSKPKGCAWTAAAILIGSVGIIVIIAIIAIIYEASLSDEDRKARDSAREAEKQAQIEQEAYNKESSLLSEIDWTNAPNLVDRQDSVEFAQKQEEEQQAEQARKALYTWDWINFVNEWGEVSGRGAVSKSVSPDKIMGFPYHDVTARIMVSCKSAWIRFSDSPNLTGGDTESGYDVYYLKVRIDGQDSRWRAIQGWSSKDLDLPSSARNTFARAQTFRIVLPWYDEGSVIFSWDLTGASDMISQTCG